MNRLTPGPVHRAGLFVLALLIAYVAYDALSDPAPTFTAHDYDGDGILEYWEVWDSVREFEEQQD